MCNSPPERQFEHADLCQTSDLFLQKGMICRRKLGQGGELALSQLALADLCMGLQLLRLKQYVFTGAPAPVALAPPFAIRNFAA